ncbi:MAG: hypothetical protein ACE5F1_02990 [Planctomycetota bacterium]
MSRLRIVPVAVVLAGGLVAQHRRLILPDGSLGRAAVKEANTVLSVVPGTYSFFGGGCRGTGGFNFCHEENKNAKKNTKTTWATKRFFAHRVKAPADLVVTGFTFLATSDVSQTIKTHVFLADGNKPAATPVRSGTLLAGPSPVFYVTMLSPSLSVRKGQEFYIGYTTPSLPNLMTECQTGSFGTYFWGGPKWNGPFTHRRFGWEIICQGASNAVPVLSSVGVPNLGKSFRVKLSRARPGGVGGLVTGLSKTRWRSLKLPFDLKQFGQDGCQLLVSFEFLRCLNVDPQGSVSFLLDVPNDARLLGFVFHNQFLVIDKGAKGGIAWSGGGTGRVGDG